jgi:hypothetical protein
MEHNFRVVLAYSAFNTGFTYSARQIQLHVEDFVVVAVGQLALSADSG